MLIIGGLVLASFLKSYHGAQNEQQCRQVEEEERDNKRIVALRHIEQEVDAQQSDAREDNQASHAPRRLDTHGISHHIGGIAGCIPREGGEQDMGNEFSRHILLEEYPQGCYLCDGYDCKCTQSEQHHVEHHAGLREGQVKCQLQAFLYHFRHKLYHAEKQSEYHRYILYGLNEDDIACQQNRPQVGRSLEFNGISDAQDEIERVAHKNHQRSQQIPSCLYPFFEENSFFGFITLMIFLTSIFLNGGLLYILSAIIDSDIEIITFFIFNSFKVEKNNS